MKHCFWRSLAALFLSLVLLFLLCSCGSDGYREVKSKSAWRKTILTVGGEDVSFELLRFYFFRHTAEADNGDTSVWTGDGAKALTEQALKSAVRDICDLYAVFALCRDWNIDPRSDSIDAVVNQYVKIDVDGGALDGSTSVGGFGGDYDAYRRSLSEIHSTDTVNRLHYRYLACLSSLYSYIVQNGAEGKIPAVEEADLRSFLEGDDCAHANYAYIGKSSYPDARAAAEELYGKMKAVEGDLNALASLVKGYHFTGNPYSGEYYGRYATDATDKARYNTIFSLSVGEVSLPVETDDGYYIYYGMAKDASVLTGESADNIRSLYLEESYIYKPLAERAEKLATEVVYKPDYAKLTYAKLSEDP